ncbi:MAG: hypothetical protein E6X17_14465 [Sporomusaceae bacterium]|nr:hypothetical protein [Sporomusaceae bacterium]
MKLKNRLFIFILLTLFKYSRPAAARALPAIKQKAQNDLHLHKSLCASGFPVSLVLIIDDHFYVVNPDGKITGRQWPLLAKAELLLTFCMIKKQAKSSAETVLRRGEPGETKGRQSRRRKKAYRQYAA